MQMGYKFDFKAKMHPEFRYIPKWSVGRDSRKRKDKNVSLNEVKGQFVGVDFS